MFEVVFEVKPKADHVDDYLGKAKMLRPELKKIDGFVDNIRYKSLQREGWILSLSAWRDEKSVVRWRTHAMHHEVQTLGRDSILADYHLRVGQLTQDTEIPKGYELLDQRREETAVGKGTFVTLITAKRPAEFAETSNPADCSEFLGLNPYASGMIDWDVYEAVLTPGDLVLLISWENEAAALAFENNTPSPVPPAGRLRHVRVARDYGMFDRREAPQYYADAAGGATIHN